VRCLNCNHDHYRVCRAQLRFSRRRCGCADFKPLGFCYRCGVDLQLPPNASTYPACAPCWAMRSAVMWGVCGLIDYFAASRDVEDEALARWVLR